MEGPGFEPGCSPGAVGARRAWFVGTTLALTDFKSAFGVLSLGPAWAAAGLRLVGEAQPRPLRRPEKTRINRRAGCHFGPGNR